MNAARWVTALVVVAAAAAIFLYHEGLTSALSSAYHGMGFGGPGLVKIGQPLPALAFESLDGSTVALHPAPNRITFINVFASWCPPCQAESPALAAFARAGVSKGIDVVGIDRQESPAVVDAFRVKFGAAYPMVIDQGWSSRDVLGARAMPETVVVDGRGVVRAMIDGPLSLAQMQALAARAKAGS